MVATDIEFETLKKDAFDGLAPSFVRAKSTQTLVGPSGGGAQYPKSHGFWYRVSKDHWCTFHEFRSPRVFFLRPDRPILFRIWRPTNWSSGPNWNSLANCYCAFSPAVFVPVVLVFREPSDCHHRQIVPEEIKSCEQAILCEAPNSSK